MYIVYKVSLYGAGKALTTVRGIHLPALADIPSYVPPPVTRVMTITFSKVSVSHGMLLKQ